MNRALLEWAWYTVIELKELWTDFLSSSIPVHGQVVSLYSFRMFLSSFGVILQVSHVLLYYQCSSY